MGTNNQNPFDKSVRALGLYENLKKDVEEERDEILNSLPQFVRIGLIEKQIGWYQEVNRYDLLVPFAVHNSFSILTSLGKDIKACTTIKPLKKATKFISEQEFRESSEIIELEGNSFSVQDFILAIAYHGTFHWKPDKKPELNQLYEKFIQQYPQTAFQMAIQIGYCIVKSFEEVYKKFTGDNNAYTTVHDHQPMIVKDGELIKDGQGKSTTYFSNSYIQLPIRKQSRCGIRICLDIQFSETPSQGFIFTYGHRDKDKIILTCEHVNKMILVKTHSTYSDVKRLIRIPITESMRKEPFKLEVALYPRGQLVVAINEWLSDCTKIPRSFSIYDGKLMVGSDLDGEKTGTFLHSALTVEAIDNKSRLRSLFISGLMKIGNFPLPNLPPDLFKRPAIIPFNKQV